MRSNGPLANKKVAMGGLGGLGGLVASWPGHSSRLAESGRLVRRMSRHVDPAAIAEEARTVRLDVVLGPPRRSVPVGDSSAARIADSDSVNHGSNPGSSASSHFDHFDMRTLHRFDRSTTMITAHRTVHFVFRLRRTSNDLKAFFPDLKSREG